MKILTYNIRVRKPEDKPEKMWNFRKANLVKLMKSEDPDIILLQEVKDFVQRRYIKKSFSNFEWFGKGRDFQWNPYSEQCAVMWNKDKFKKIKADYMFLSETPWKRSKGWDGKYVKVFVWVILEEIVTGKQFMVMPIHLETFGMQAKIKGAKQIKDFCEGVTIPIIFGGDFNAHYQYQREVFDSFDSFAKDANLHSKSIINGECGTYNAFIVGNNKPEYRGDYIYGKGIEMIECKTLDENYGLGYTPSDHLPITLEFNLQ
jgi:endonuclease/exonuclease/phosphatase family metal-dependent hydrolase